MSEQDLALIRRWFESWNDGDMDTIADLFDVDAEVITDPSWMEAGPFKGRTAIRNWFAGLKESWGGRDVAVVKELFEAGDNVVARIEWQVRGRASGIESELDATGVNTIGNGRIVRQQWFFDYDEALEAVGLSKR